jgi:hypothetical protein
VVFQLEMETATCCDRNRVKRSGVSILVALSVTEP